MDRAGAPHPDPPGEVLRTQLVAPPRGRMHLVDRLRADSAPGRLTLVAETLTTAEIDERSERDSAASGGAPGGMHRRSSRTVIVSTDRGNPSTGRRSEVTSLRSGR